MSSKPCAALIGAAWTMATPIAAAAAAISAAVDAVLADPAERTADLGGRSGTRAFAAAVVDKLRRRRTQ